MGRDSIVGSKKELRDEGPGDPGEVPPAGPGPAILSGREFNVGLIGGKKLRVLPLAEVDYSQLPQQVPPIMSYAAKWIETSVEYQRISVICPADVEPGLAAADLRHGGQGFPGHRRLGLRTGGHPPRRGPRAPRPRGELQSLPRRGHRPGPVGAIVAGIPYPDLLNLIIQAAFEGPPHDVQIPMTFAVNGRGARRR